ncbi:DNA polymerase III subunit beta [bacterium]|nr:DNA polymerase III subunit beta [bacterium]
MKFTINQHNLFEGLQKVIGVVPAKSTTPALENLLFDLTEQKLRITGTDLEVTVTTEIQPDKIEETGAVALPARVITEMMRSLPDISVQFESDSGYKMKITTEQGFYQISGISKENYPALPEPTEENVVNVENTKLSRMLSKTIFAVSVDELRPALMGVFLQMKNNELRMVATDGHRLSKIVDTGYKGDTDNLQLIIPPKAVQIVLKNLDSEGSTRLVIDNSSMSFELGNTILHTRLVEGQYPDYERVIPQDNEKSLLVDKQLLAASVKRVSLFSSQLTRQIRFSLVHEKLTILSEDVDVGGEAREELSVDYQDEPMEIGFNSQYLSDIIKQIDTDEIEFKLKTPISAALVLPVQQREDESFMMLLMPIKLSV